MEHLKRYNSVCVDPKDELLKAVIENKQFEIENLVKRIPGILWERYDGKYLKPILYLAIKDEADVVTTNTVSCLIKEGAPLNFIDLTWHAYEAIHFAALGQNPSILKCIIKHYHEKLMDISVAAKNGSTALHVLIKDGNPKRNGFEECVRILLENNLNYNLTDDRNSPPIYWAAKKGYKNIVTLMLSYPNLDLDSYTFRNKTARDLIQELNIVDIGALPKNKNRENNNNNMLLDYIKQSKETEFIALANRLGDLDDDNLEKSFLQYACDKYLLEVVRYLISKGVDKNRVTKKHPMSPIEMAAGHGYHIIVALLIEQQDIYVSNDVLLYILPKLDYDVTDKVDYKTCFDLVMSSGKSINVNHKDKNGYYPLHYAARYGGPDTVLSLLSKKASLANRNAFDNLNISEIDYNTLKQHFDNCIEAIPDNRLDKESMTITFDYETLLPTKANLRVTQDCDEEKNLCKKKTYATPETDAVLFMSKSSELKTLLKHPLITSFLYVKWYRIRWIFYTNFIFYLTFLTSLLLYIFAYYKEPDERRHAMLFMFLLVTTGILLAREVFQMMVGPKKYFSNFENFIEVSLIGIVGFMLFDPNASPDTRTQAAAFAFLLAAFELLFLLGNYPGLSTNIVMLRTVSLNFFKFLCFYSILIIAFAFCFHTLFKPHAAPEVSHNGTDLQVEEEDDDKFFVNPIISMFKTVIMLTGEFEAGELKFENYPVTSHLIFLAFVMTIAIILLNLLNGLAVSDTQEIKNEAELVGQIARAEYIAYAESMIFSGCIPSNVTNWYYGIFPCQGNNNFKRLMSKPLTQSICIYPEYLTGFKLVIYPNQSGRVHFENEKNDSCKCRNLYLDKETVRRSRSLLQEKKEREKEQRERQKWSDMQFEILQKLNELLAKE